MEARAERRLATKYARVRDRDSTGGATQASALTRKQLDLLKQYDSGELLREVNRLTLLSGHGRLRHSDGSHVDIGGSTGGWTRTALYGWTPPDLQAFKIFDPEALCEPAAAEGT